MRRRSAQIAERQREADVAVERSQQGVLTTQVGYMDMLNLQRLAERVAEGHARLQRENGFGYRVFGIEGNIG